MRRTLALAVLVVAAGCGAPVDERPWSPARPAEPQRAELGWQERYPATGLDRLVFGVESFEVTSRGWAAEVSIRNDARIRFEMRPDGVQLRYGLMLFASGDAAELDRANKSGGLPFVRPALELEPEPPAMLAPGATWRARFSARGALPAGAHVRLVFGPLRARGKLPEGMRRVITWITDRSYRLRG